MLNLFYSNSFKFLSDHLQDHFFASDPFTKKVVIIPNRQIKEYLIYHISKKMGICLGITWLTLDEALNRYWDTKDRLFPTHEQLYLALFQAVEEKKLYTDIPQLPFFIDRLARQYKEHCPDEEIGCYICEKGIWTTYPNAEIAIKEDIVESEIHLVGFSFLPQKIMTFFTALAEKKELFFYLFSPCSYFWEDILSDKEIRKNLSFFRKKRMSESSMQKWLLLAKERNPVLASLGKMGRENIKCLPDRCQEEHFYVQGEDSLLGSLQEAIVHSNTPEETRKQDDSLLLIEAGEAKYKEVERLNLLLKETFAKDSSLKYADVTVYAPNINDYSSLVQSIIDFPCVIEDRALRFHSFLIEGLLAYTKLLEDPFSLEKLLSLLANPTFKADIDIEQVKEIFHKVHIKCGIGQRDYSFSLEEGMKRILMALATISQQSNLDITSYEWINTCVELLYSLQRLLVYKQKEARFTCNEWIELISNDIFLFFDQSKESSGSQAVAEIINSFFQEKFSDSTFPFSILMHLFVTQLGSKKVHVSENNLNAIFFRSLQTDSVTTSSVIALLGMEEAAFPRKEEIFYAQTKEYLPTQMDKDRYLFLQILLSARKKLWFFYRSFSEEDGKEQAPSLLIDELLSYLDHHIKIDQKKASDSIKRTYPLSTYHPSFHQPNCSYPSFLHYKAAKRYLEGQKEKISFPLFPFSFDPIGEDLMIAAHKFKRACASPIQHFLTSQGIYLEREEDETFFLPSYMQKKAVEGLLQKGDVALEEMKKNGIFPEGLFAEISEAKINQKMQLYQNNMQKLGIAFDESFEIEVTNRATVVIDGYRVCFTGKLPLVHPDGIISLEKNSFENALKIWPLCLLYQWLYPTKKLSLFFLQDGIVKELPPFSEKVFTIYIRYFIASQSNLFPFSPSLLSSFLRGKKVTFDTFFDPYANWLTKQKEIELKEEELWMEKVKTLYQPLMEIYGI